MMDVGIDVDIEGSDRRSSDENSFCGAGAFEAAVMVIWQSKDEDEDVVNDDGDDGYYSFDRIVRMR